MKLRPLVFSLLCSLTLLLPTINARALELVQSVPEGSGLEDSQLQKVSAIWFNMVHSAERNIDIGQYYFSNLAGSDLDRVIAELEAAGARGVKIRVVVDKKMQANDPATYERVAKIANTELRYYDISKITGGIIHAKYIIVDRRKVFIGSQNFDWRALTQIHETGVYLENEEIAAQLGAIFEIDWNICAGKLPSKEGPVYSVQDPYNKKILELVASPPQFNPNGVRYSLDALKELLSKSKKTVNFMVMNYSPSDPHGAKEEYWGDLDNALKEAVKRGVKVRMMVADWNMNKTNTAYLRTLTQAKGIQLRVVSIPQQRECVPFARVMHSKLLMVDGSVQWIGTSNWSKGYFTATRGVELIVKNKSVAADGERIFQTLWTSAYAKDFDPQAEYTPPDRTCGAGVKP